MFAPANIPAIELLAAQIITSDYSGLPVVDRQFYENSDWEQAAQYALDSEDYSELAYMASREEAYDHFVKLGLDDLWGFFDNWYDQLGRTMFPAASVGVAA